METPHPARAPAGLPEEGLAATSDDGMAPPSSLPPPGFRLVGRGGIGTGIRRVGLGPQGLGDLYYRLLHTSWTRLLLLTFAAYLGIVTLFALLYLPDPGAVAGVRPGSFVDAFFFSVQTFATIGYGGFAPQSLYGHVIVTLEAFVGMLSIAMMAGLAFSKFSRPSARVIFSEQAVLGPFDGRRALVVRMANARDSRVVEATVRLTLAIDETTVDGRGIRRLYDLPLVRGWTPLFALTWMAVHVVDDASPLFAASPASLAAANAEVVVSIVGLDETFGQAVHAQFSYVAAEIVWGARFVDVVQVAPGERIVDYRRLHDVEPLEDVTP
jgi:inward rectifier potassium channel